MSCKCSPLSPHNKGTRSPRYTGTRPSPAPHRSHEAVKSTGMISAQKNQVCMISARTSHAGMISARTSIIHHRGQPFFIIIHHKSVNIILKEKFFDSCFVKYLLMTAVQE